MAANINYRNINYLRNNKLPVKSHLVAELFDDVNTAYGQLAAKHADTEANLKAALKRIEALESGKK